VALTAKKTMSDPPENAKGDRRAASHRKCHDSARRIKRDGLSRKPRLSFREIWEIMGRNLCLIPSNAQPKQLELFVEKAAQ